MERNSEQQPLSSDGKPTWVSLPPSDAANVDNITSAAIVPLLHYRHNSLCHVDKSSHVGGEHNLNVLRLNLGRLINTLHQPSIVHKDIDFLELIWKIAHKSLDFLGLADVQLDGENFDTIADFLADGGGDFL
jgi:hypothetical protein